MKKTTQWILVLNGIAGLSLFGAACAPSDDHSDHDHEHEEQADAGAAKDSYPLTTCLVSGEPLDSMGGPVSIEHEGTTVKFCCESCIDEFKETPEQFLPKLTQAAGK